MAISTSYNLGNLLIQMKAREVVASEVGPEFVVRIRVMSFDMPAETVNVVPVTPHRFQLGLIPLPTALPTIIPFVLARLDGVHETVRQLCNDQILRFSFQGAVEMMDDASALELVVDIGLLLVPDPDGSNEDVEEMGQWMRENPLEEEEEMGEGVHYVYEDNDVSHDGFGSVPASGSFIEGLQRFAYGRGDDIREVECMICLGEFDAPAQVSTTPCSHAFHSHCIIQWLHSSHLCPICRYSMPTTTSH